MSNLTPLMKQYWEIKSLHKDKILLFRMGDFYEMFFDDAIKAAPLLGIALTQRNKKSQDETPMCGMPHHSVAGPINKLLSHGLKVAICDQIEDPKTAKGIVKRAVTRVLTPGMVYDPETLDQNRSHYLACADDKAVSFIDITTGESFFIRVRDFDMAFDYIKVLPVAELVCSEENREAFTQRFTGLISPWSSLIENEDLHLPKNSPESARRLLAYVRSICSPDTLGILQSFEERKILSRMHLSPTVLRHLEVFYNNRGEEKGSLFESLCRTKTPAGTRRFREYLQFPLTEASEIEERLNHVEYWRERLADLKSVRETLGKMGDLERRLSKLSFAQANARDLLSLSQGLEIGLKALSQDRRHDIKSDEWEVLSAFHQEVSLTIVEDPPLSTKQGEMIRRGVSKTLDEYIELTTDAHKLLMEMEAREKAQTQIPSLKIRYNNVFGYYIEVTNTHKDKVPSHYQRKQTLSTAERFVTEELLELEKKVITAQSRRFELEYEIFEDLRRRALSLAPLILKVSRRCGYLDVETSLAWLSLEQKYVRPKFNEEGVLHLQASRHPVVEISLKGSFTPNDLKLDKSGCLLLTGPNMAGKSTLMRQVALTVLMAQMGSFVPAGQADLPVVDQIFTRIGASDSLTEGLSTFMVEMTETSEMLKKATSRSLLILDEVGRGTSTYDGMALAQGILEFILKKLKCLTLFATHYHELTSLAESFGQVQNAHMSVVDRNGKIEFLHTLEPGPALKSYGIHVAELAGLPGAIIQRAETLLKGLESQPQKSQLSLLDWNFEEPEEPKSVTWDPRVSEFLQQVKSFEVARATPLEALNQIAQWQKSCPDPT